MGTCRRGGCAVAGADRAPAAGPPQRGQPRTHRLPPPGPPEYSLGDERYGAKVVEVACRYLSLAVALVAVLAVASSALADVAPLSVAQTQRLENQGVRDIIVKHRPDLSSSERADLRADADVTHLRNLVLRDAELVRAPPASSSRRSES